MLRHDAPPPTLPVHASIGPVRLWWRRFFIRLRSWEYWPVYIFSLPMVGIWIWYAIRARDFFFFSLTNPGIPTGGFFGESKSAILAHIPADAKPAALLLRMPVTPAEAIEMIKRAGLRYPMIAKPEVGERGWNIERVNDNGQLADYLARHPIDTILQEYVDFPVELSIMAYSMPDGSDAGVTSVCEKHFLQVTGDGHRTLGDLILAQDRAVLQYEKLRRNFADRWPEILPAGETLILEHVGNHCRGTMFLNRNDRIDAPLTHVILRLLRSMPGVYYGRFDMRVSSWAALREGRDIRVLEFNGASAEPAHIYQPGYSLVRAYRDIARHWGIMFRIARQNRAVGHPPAGVRKMISALILYFRYKRDN